MTDEKWDIFASTGKIADYLEYKGISADTLLGNGDINGNGNPQGNSSS
ncbi:MAG: hypothetical protein ACI4JB_03870 [Porcipelethomonas sp.]